MGYRMELVDARDIHLEGGIRVSIDVHLVQTIG